MLKKMFKGAGVALSFLSIGSMASAGSLAEGVADPEVENLVVEEGEDRGLGIWPIVGLVVIGALIASNGGSDSSSSEEEPTSPEPK